MGVVVKGLSNAALLLTGRYHLVFTNVPYLARGKQCDQLKAFCDKFYPKAKNDLANVFWNVAWSLRNMAPGLYKL